MMFKRRFRSAFCSWLTISLLVAVATGAQAGDTVGTWRRYVVELTNSSFSGNAFELEVDATFTHAASGEQITLPGYYAGAGVWKIAFMPTQIGEWTYTTNSSDADLNGRFGSVVAVASNNPGTLKADPAHPKKWKHADGPYVGAILQFRVEFFSDPDNASEFAGVAEFMAANHLHILETRLIEEDGQFEGGRHDFIFEGDWRNHQFDLRIWDRMEERMEMLTDLGLGAHIMFYSDDAGTPGWVGQSETEALVIRYVTARLAAFPVVIFNTGIDIAEYRSQADIDWFGQQIRALDPYGHPVSSRYGGGSGGMVMSDQTFDSRGDRLAIIGDMTSYFQGAEVPVAMDDAWHENSPGGASRGKDFTEHDIRRAIWKCVMAGGLGAQIRGYDGFFHLNSFQSDLESEQFLRLINPFVEEKLGNTFGSMVPSSSLVSNGYALADPARTKILYFAMGQNDRYDSGNGGAITLKLSGESGKGYNATWFDPRDGSETSIGILGGGTDHTISPPSTDDWVLLLTETKEPEGEPEPGVLVTIEAVGSGGSYGVAVGLSTGDLVYTDRSYSYSQIPVELQGANYIQTPNDDKAVSVSNLLTLIASQAVTVYVGHDDRVSPKPDWLSEFGATGLQVVTQDLQTQTYTLYAKTFDAGSIVLGPNQSNSASSDASMYFVIVRAPDGTQPEPLGRPGKPYVKSE
jgi:hypothetical protein